MNFVSDSIDLCESLVAQLGKNNKLLHSQRIAIDKIRVYVKDPSYLKVGDVVVLDGVSSEITLVNFADCYFEAIYPDASPLPTSNFDYPTVYFKHGKIAQVNNELNKINDAMNFTPLVYFVEVSGGNFDTDPDRQSDFENDARLLFLNQANFGDWLNDDHYEKAIKPAEKMMTAFIDLLNASPKVRSYVRGRGSNHALVGSTFTSEDESLFSFYFSGVEISLTIPLIKKDCKI